jgi:hypothetical protein
MKISRFTVAVFGLGLISQVAFSYAPKAADKKGTPKITCEKSVLPLFNKEENRPCKDAKPVVKHEKKSKKTNHKATCGVGCHKSILPLFNEKENRPCKCPETEKNMTPKMVNGTTKAIAKK